ncbi:tRNA pseudouridine(13) synthase TruD [Marinobacter confluentis]|uniref:tRNA pseudouridine synthase D n=1 Tax=Marinobacter confluentis TaxID=1697557 RepID=A0A4Z1C8C1_9GAMM|nr:tRNA pseudouridine(13) synthase TruD [Marinobacter confluentis]TGN41960.1 tRNA pseudouridine(13) synthase TruD [Marinobacter confluentis]
MTDSEQNNDEPERWRLDWPTSSGTRAATAVLKASPADFMVDEKLDVSGFNGGEHLLFRIEKTGDNTEYVARQLAVLAGCRPFDVGFCGLKDRHAVTRQWFSVYRPGLEGEDSELIARVAETWPVLESCRAPKKLRRSDHQGNGFEIVLTNVSGQQKTINLALAQLREYGCPNYFGPQRFGHEGGNLDQAIAMDPATMISGRGHKGKKRGRGRSSSGGNESKNVLYFSAARSWLFNEVLAHRVEVGNWQTLLDGEPGLPGLADAFITGPLWGDGGTEAVSVQGELERAVVSEHPQVAAVFAITRMKPERRQLTLMPEDLQWRWLAADRLSLAFGLAPGQYATTLLGDLFDLAVSGDNRANSVIQ